MELELILPSLEDAHLILEWENNPEFIPEVGYEGPYNLEDITDLIASFHSNESIGQIRFLIVSDNVKIGALDFFKIDDESKCCEVAILIAAKELRRKGIAYAAIKKGMSMMHLNRGLSEFTARVHLQNNASLGLFNKLDFRENSINDVFSILKYTYP